MDVATLMTLERRLASGGADDYREVLHPDALLVLPGMVLDADACVAAMADSPGWDGVDLGEPSVLRTASTITVVYEFVGRRGDRTYRATSSSTYVDDDGRPRLLHHQQTPAEPA